MLRSGIALKLERLRLTLPGRFEWSNLECFTSHVAFGPLGPLNTHEWSCLEPGERSLQKGLMQPHVQDLRSEIFQKPAAHVQGP